jgi:hypothetical protein
MLLSPQIRRLFVFFRKALARGSAARLECPNDWGYAWYLGAAR